MLIDNDIKRTVSYEKKKANNFKRQKKLMNIYNMYWYDEHHDIERLKRIDTNANLLNGIVDEEDYNTQSELELEKQIIPIGYGNIVHYPLIAGVAEAAIGEEMLMPFKISVQDLSNGYKSARKRKEKELIRSYIEQVHIEPIRQKVLQQIPPEALENMPPEQQQELMGQVEQQVSAMTPKEIKEYIEIDYKSKEQIQGQRLMNYLSRNLQLRNLKNQGFESHYAYAEVYYLVGEENDEPFLKVLNPKFVEWAPSPTSPWIQDAEYALYREQVTIQEAFARDGEYLEKADVKKLTELVHGYEDSARPSTYEITQADERVLFEISKDDNLLKSYGPIDMHTMDGQNKMIRLYEDVLRSKNLEHGNMYLTRTYMAWRDMVYYKRVQRRDQSGKKAWYWEAEQYAFNPANGDIKIKTVEKPEVWHGIVYGYGDNAVYLKIEPFPYQHKGVHSIHNPKLPFFGGKTNTRQGNASMNVSCVDLGKKWNYAFDLQMAELKAQQATNLGKVFIMLKELKPDGIEWGEWVATMKYLKMVLLEATKEEGDLAPHLAQILKGIDMSVMSDLTGAINMLNWYQQKLAETMYFSQERLGRIGQYMTAANSQQAVSASQVMTTRLFDVHNQIFEKALQFLFDVARVAYKENTPKSQLILGDIDQADLDIDWEMIHRAELGVFISISPTDAQKVNEIKARTLEIIQNQMLDVEDLFDFISADTTGELKNISANVNKKRKEAQAAQAESEEQRIQQAVQVEMAKLEQDIKGRLELQALRNQGNLEAAQVDATKFAAMMDIDGNKQSDRVESDREKIEWEKEKFRMEMDLKLKELELKRLEIESRNSNR